MSDEAVCDDGAISARGPYRMMFARVFGPFFWGRMVSSAGIWIYNIVAAVVAFQVTGSAFVVGLVTVAQFGPQVVLAPLSGKVADFGNAPLQLVLGQLIVGVGSGGLAAWIWLAGGTDGMSSASPVIAASLLVGMGFVVGGPAMQAVVPTMIRPGELATAMAVNSIPTIFARAVGPALGALAASRLGAAAALAIAAAFSLCYGLIVLALRLPRKHNHSTGTDFSVLASLRHVQSDRPLLLLLLAIAAVGFGAEPSMTLAPSIAAALGADAGFVGWLASSFGIGAAVGFVLFHPLHRRLSLARLTNSGLLTMAAGLVLATTTSAPGLTLASFGVAGVGMTLAYTSITTQIQQRSPDVLRGRIMALWFVGFLGSRPFAAAMDGYLADVASVDLALLVTAGILTAAAYVSRPSRLSASAP